MSSPPHPHQHQDGRSHVALNVADDEVSASATSSVSHLSLRGLSMIGKKKWGSFGSVGAIPPGAGGDGHHPSHSRHASYWSISEMTFTPLVNELSQAVLTWKDLTVRSKKNPDKQILKSVTGRITGGFWALMGPSGSGKSTLVNALACRLTPGMYAEGEVRLNGREYSLSDLKSVSGYVMQDDLMNGALTVEETLFFAGELRLPRSMLKEDRKERVEESIYEMGIDHVRNVVVGDSLRKGISGGERKRLAVAMEILTHPQLLFLDEPTR